MHLFLIVTTFLSQLNVQVLYASFESRIVHRSTGCIRSFVTNRIKWRAADTCRAGERRDREAFVYINQLICPTIITVIGAAITGEQVITQSVRQ